MQIQTPAQLVGYNQKADRSMTLRFSTREYQPNEIEMIAELFQSEGWLLFSPNEFKETDIPKEEADTEGKSPSKRLRSVIFVYWKQQGEKGDFEQFYRRQMERLIERVKGLLEPNN